MNADISGALAERVVRTGFADLPATTVDRLKLLLLDAVGVGLAGSGSARSQAFLAGVRRAHGSAEVGVPGTAERLSAEGAAMVLAHNMHCLEFDAIHEPAVVHPLSVVVPSLVADLVRARADGLRAVNGRELLTALAVGIDVAARLGSATSSALRFFRPGTAGIFGAVASMASARSYGVDAVINAMGIAYGQVCGTMQAHTEGVPLLAAQVGFNARNAVQAIALHEAEIVGPRHVFDGSFGYFGLIEAAGDPALLVDGWGGRWEADVVSIKPYPSGRATHGAIDAALALRADAAASPVASITASVPPMILHLVGRPVLDEMPANYARLCVQVCMAMALERGRVGLEDFPALVTPSRRELEIARSITLVTDANSDPNAFLPQRFEAVFADGSTRRLVITDALGSPERPLEPQDVVDKFIRCAEVAAVPMNASTARTLADQILAIEECGDVSGLSELDLSR